jgi:DNA polymerase-1
MNFLVTKKDVSDVIQAIRVSPSASLDCESTGLMVHLGDRLFSIAISTGSCNFYFNFKSYNGLDEALVLDRSIIPSLVEALKNKDVYFANAKFDMHLLRNEGAYLDESSVAWDVLVIDKIFDNSHFKYSLAEVSVRHDEKKSEAVDEHIFKHRLYTVKKEKGKKTSKKDLHFDLVPFELISEYAMNDAAITYRIGVRQRANYHRFKEVIDTENRLTKVCFDMENRGVLLDENYVSRAMVYEQDRAIQAANKFKEITGMPFVDSGKALSVAFRAVGIAGGKTEKGNESFTDEVLAQIKHPLAELVREYRDANKRCGTYYQSFLSFADNEQIIHPNINQAQAKTFRFSITNPALQTLNKEEGSTGPFKIRDSFIARPGYVLTSIDYAQQEYRLAADYAGELKLINKINNGLDVHLATSEIMGVDRKRAKTISFAFLYGQGIDALGESLGVDRKTAYSLREKYFASLPNVSRFIQNTIKTAKVNREVVNYYGMKLKFPEPEFAYKAPNYLIQSTGAAIMRRALNEINCFLKSFKSKLILSIHDEVVLEMSEDELHLVSKIREIMVSVYKPQNGLGMDTSVSYGLSLGSMVEGDYVGIKTGNELQEESRSISKIVTKDPYFYGVSDELSWNS